MEEKEQVLPDEVLDNVSGGWRMDSDSDFWHCPHCNFSELFCFGDNKEAIINAHLALHENA